MPAVTPNSKNPLRGAVEIIPDRLYYVALKAAPNSNKIILRNRRNRKVPVDCFSIDNELVYWNFFLDFGPLNLGQLRRFSTKLNHLIQRQEVKKHQVRAKAAAQQPRSTSPSNSSGINNEVPVILFYSSTVPAKRANAIFVICAWQMLHLNRTPEEAFHGFKAGTTCSADRMEEDCGSTIVPAVVSPTSSVSFSSSRRHGGRRSEPPPSPLTSIGQATVASLPPFHDASPCACTYDLTLMQCLHGLQKARRMKFFDWDNFNVEEYEHFEQVENGDLNWIIQKKFLAFAGPSFKKTVSPEGYCTLAPSDYIPYFKKNNVGLVVRLNKKCYEEQDFVKAGIGHLEQFYLDGSCPPMKILQRVISAFEAVPREKAIAVHCKAGLGRTGTCIGAYMMKHYRFTASEAIGWMRICRPGMVIGPQQHFLEDLEPTMWQEGELMRGNVTSSIRSKKSASCRASSSRDTQRSSTSSNGRSSSKPSSPRRFSPDEAVVGRKGQAEGLLAARRHPRTTGGMMGPISPEGHAKAKAKPIPITPDKLMAPLMIGDFSDASEEETADLELPSPPSSSSWVKS